MKITRRAALKNLLLVAAATTLLPSCLEDAPAGSVSLKKLKITGEQERMLASLTETIIPTTETPGAKDISAHLFVLKMVDDCYTKEEQQTFMEGFKAFEEEVKKKYKNSYDKLEEAQKVEFLTALEAEQAATEPISSFYKSAMNLTVLGYTTSEYFMTKVRGYNIIPGKYQGAVKVQKSTSANA